MTSACPAAPRRRRLPARAALLLMPLILSIRMTFVISGVSTLMAFGVDPELHLHWLKAWGTSWIVGFPVLLVILPLVRRIVAALVEPG